MNTRQCHGYTSTASRDCVSRGKILTLHIWLRSDQDNNAIFKLSVSRKNRFVDSLFDTTSALSTYRFDIRSGAELAVE